MKYVRLMIDHDNHGWVVTSPEIAATAIAATRKEALINFLELLKTYPELLDEALA